MPENSRFCMVYVTTPDAETATKIAKLCVEDRLAACANILPTMHAVFWWAGEVQSDSEAVLILKTEMDLFEKLRERVVELHPYDVPAVLQLPVTRGHRPYLEWLIGQTQDGEPSSLHKTHTLKDDE